MNISNTTWNKSAPLELFLTNGEPITVIENVEMQDTGKIRANNDEYKTSNVTYD